MHHLTRAIGLAAAVSMGATACTASENSAVGVDRQAVEHPDVVDQAGVVEDATPGVDQETVTKRAALGTITDESGAVAEPLQLPAGIEIDGDAVQVTLDDGSTVTRGDVVVTTDAGSVRLPDAEVIESVDGRITTIGSVPLPDAGPLADAVPMALPKGKVGTATGAELSATVPHLNPDTVYTYLLFRGDLALDTGIDGGASDLLDHVEIFGQEPGIVVIDPDDYFYVGGTCPGGGTSDKERQDAVDSASDFDPVVLSLRPAEVAVPCGFGISNMGNILATPDLTSESAPISDMSAHVVVHGAEVVSPGLALDGTFYFQLLEPGFRLIANGTLLASLSVISGKVGLDLPLGDASIDMGVSDDGLAARFVSETPDLSTLELPVPIDITNVAGANGGVRAEGALDFAIAADGTPSIGSDSYLQMAGRLDLDTGVFGDLVGMELGALSVDGMMRIDSSGISVAGTATGSFIPGLDIEAGAHVETFVAFDDIANSSILVSGSLGIGGFGLAGEAGARLDRNGVEAWGSATLPFGELAVRGAITADGAYLEGSTRAMVPLGPIADAASAVRGELDKAKDEVAKLDVEIERLRADINAGRDANQAGLRQAQADVAVERGKLDAILDTMAYNRGEIRRMQDEQEASWDPFYDASLSFQIAALELANVAQDGYRIIAQGALDIAIGALRLIEAGLEIIPVDADPRIVAFVIAREAALLILDGASAVLSLVPDEVRADLEITVGTNGFVGEAGIETCLDGVCSTLVSGSVQSAPPQLCFVLLDQNICVGLPELALAF